MTTERDDEARLRALFDRTADDASGPTLTRLSARAREVPSQGRRSWLSQLWAPALAVAAGAFAVVLATGQFASLKPTPVASTPASTSEWPLIALVAECMTMSAPSSSGFCSTGVAAVESTASRPPDWCAQPAASRPAPCSACSCALVLGPLRSSRTSLERAVTPRMSSASRRGTADPFSS